MKNKFFTYEIVLLMSKSPYDSIKLMFIGGTFLPSLIEVFLVIFHRSTILDKHNSNSHHRSINFHFKRFFKI